MRLHFKLLFTLLGLFSMTTVVQAGELPFTDANRSDHFEAIYKMKEWGIFDGYSDGSFGYIKEINRAELSKVLVLGSGLEESEVSSCADGASKSFSDVTAGQWYSDYVYCAQANGWVSGDDGANTFRPGDPVLLPEAFKMILESQYGTPDESFEGGAWYDRYVNLLVDSNIIYQDSDWGSYFYYTFLPGYSTMGFDSIITSKTTRQDIAELLYRVRTVLEEGDGELGEYDPMISIADYEEKYGASVEETSNGVLAVQDPHFGFELENLYMGDLSIGDIKIYVENPSGSQNGFNTKWKLLAPALEPDSSWEGHSNLLTITIEDSNGEGAVSARCPGQYSYSFELWSIYSTLCGELGENEDSIGALLRLRAYGEAYEGEEPELTPITDRPLSILTYNNVIASAANGISSGEEHLEEYLDYLDSLKDLEVENAEQKEVLLDWLIDFETEVPSFAEAANMGTSAEQSAALSAIWALYTELDELIEVYEKEVLESFGETLTIDVDLDYITGYGYDGYAFYRVDSSDFELIGEASNYFWNTFSLYFSESYDPFEGEYFGKDGSIEGGTVRVTVLNQPIPSSDFVDPSDEDWHHVFQYATGFYQNAYYYEIVDVEVVE